MAQAHQLDQSVIPFLKWAGGKRWLTKSLREIIGPIEGRYIEPFLGGAAVFFAIKPEFAVLSDCNKELIDTYKAIKNNHVDVQRYLAAHQKMHNKEYYYSIRGSIPEDPIEKAARFIYLNRTCWNGLYRVNLKGQFNVPIGTKNTVLLDSDNFEMISNILDSADLFTRDFELAIDDAKKGDVVFCDPPYTVRHKNNGFVKYNEDLFLWQDQVRLKNSLSRARERGVRIFATNADHVSLRELYAEEFVLVEYERFSPIGGLKALRGSYSELLICG